MQNAVYVRGVAKSSEFHFQTGKLFNIFNFEAQYLAVGKMIEQGLHL